MCLTAPELGFSRDEPEADLGFTLSSASSIRLAGKWEGKPILFLSVLQVWG